MEKRRADLAGMLTTPMDLRPLAKARQRAWPVHVEGLTLGFFVNDEPPRDQWRISVTTQPVLQHARYLSRVAKAKVCPVHTVYGTMENKRQIEAYLCRYDRADGWFGPISAETMLRVFLRLKNEGTTFLEAEPLP
ncbi:MAG: hypothetical protein RL033_4046 [Pseudomonadota bacterium]|jgi:hypothetical protein